MKKLSLVQQVLERDGYICQTCLKQFPIEELAVHHVIPRRLYGLDSLNNMTTVCPKCHILIELQWSRGLRSCKSTTTNTHAVVIGLALPEELVKNIDADRGDVPRSKYVTRIIQKFYERR